ncbi:MAG TPA: tripartite tricarboxylate transporter substrate binding protein [Burkholderiales bacterium]|nr:tripartite tricarboxylate transporter substrate binding protein [Burkholderiales bacterium]
MVQVVRVAFLSLCAFCAASPALAGSYPERPIRLIVPFSPGGGTDINARILADPMGNNLGQTIVIDNRPGAGSMLGSSIVAKAEPDGYTLLIGTTSLTVNTAVYREMPFDPQRDLAPITRVSDQPSIVVVHPSLPARTFKEFVAMVQAAPGKYSFGSPGAGTGTRLASEMLWLRANLKMLHVPFKGTGPALTALLGQEITTYMSTFASALPHVKQGRLRAYAVTTAKRAGPLPEVPTLAEAGVPDYEYATWYGLFAPAGTPQSVVDKVHKAAVDALRSPAVLKVYAQQGLNAIPTTPQEFARYIAGETRKWSGVVRDAHIARM